VFAAPRRQKRNINMQSIREASTPRNSNKSENSSTIHGWPADLLAEISAAASRQCAAALIALSRSAIDALPDRLREHLNAALQDTIQEIRAAQADEAKIIASKTYSIFGLALQNSPDFQPTIGTQLALGHARDAVETMVGGRLADRDRRLAEKIRAVFESSVP
jgi:hypothetical protein